MIKDITGQRFGRLVAISFVSAQKRGTMWRFRCDCGNEKEISQNAAGRTTFSCGCLHVERAKSIWSSGVMKGTRRDNGNRNFAAKEWRLRSPANKLYQFKNLLQFIRENEALFDPDDVRWVKHGRGGLSCKASAGLGSLSVRSKNPIGSWKGWTWNSLSLTGTIDNALRIKQQNLTGVK